MTRPLQKQAVKNVLSAWIQWVLNLAEQGRKVGLGVSKKSKGVDLGRQTDFEFEPGVLGQKHVEDDDQ